MTTRILTPLLMCLLSLSGPALAGAQSRTVVAGLPVGAGTMATGHLTIPAGPDPGTIVPVTVVRGARPGPTLALVAGVHGSEFSPILALQRLPARLDPTALAGTVIMVHVANLPSFLGRTIYTGPVDGKNLNRAFPGRPDGSLTERIAHAITTQVIDAADVVIDVHSGDANEDLRPWTGYYAKHGTPDVIARSRDLAVAFGVDYIVRFPFVPNPPDDLRYTGANAVARGKPSFDVEVGGLGRIVEGDIELIVSGLLSVMRHLEMLEGPATPAAAPWFIDERAYHAADQDGIFYPAVRAGEFVREGMTLGRVTDFHGRTVQTVPARATGVVLVAIASPPVRKGDTLVTIGVSGGR